MTDLAPGVTSDPNGWFNVDEKPPETGEPCWIVWSNTVQQIAYRRVGIGFACERSYEWEAASLIEYSDPIPDDEVTHWQPLPEPPVSKGGLKPSQRPAKKAE